MSRLMFITECVDCPIENMYIPLWECEKCGFHKEHCGDSVRCAEDENEEDENDAVTPE